MDRWQSQLTGWGAQSNGHVRWRNEQRVDLHDVQEIAFEKGMIDYIPADRDEDGTFASTLADLCISMSIGPLEL